MAAGLALLVTLSLAVPGSSVAPKAASAAGRGAPSLPDGGQLRRALGQLPPSFVANAGQADPGVAFQARGSGYSLHFSASGLTLVADTATGPAARLAEASPPSQARPGFRGLDPADERGSALVEETVNAELARGDADDVAAARPGVLTLDFPGSAPDVVPVGETLLPGIANFFIGADPSRWRTGVPMFGGVRYPNLYPDIDLVYRGEAGRRLKSEWEVAPGADPSLIRLRYGGDVTGLTVETDGALRVRAASGDLVEAAPVSYQMIAGRRQEVASGYTLLGEREAGFWIGAYDSRYPLVLDPALVYSTYLDGSSLDEGLGIAVDAAGNAYVTGNTASSDFPTKKSLFPYKPITVAFVTKLNATGTALVYSTYLGSVVTFGRAIAVDSQGNAYITGQTDAADFPVTANRIYPDQAGVDAFVTKLNATGTALVYSTYLGGSGEDIGNAIAVDGQGNAYVTGNTKSINFPTTPGAYQTTSGGDQDVFVTKLNVAGTALAYSTYLGGKTREVGNGIAVDTGGNAFVAGATDSLNFPATPNGTLVRTPLGQDAFVTKLNATGTGLLYSTYFGGDSGEEAYAVAVDAAGNAYVTGDTSSATFPTTPGSFQPTSGGAGDTFVAKLNATGTAFAYSTYLGGNRGDFGRGIAVDAGGNAYVIGRTNSPNFPITPNRIFPDQNRDDAFVAKLNTTGTQLLFSSYLGASLEDFGSKIALDGLGNVYVTGITFSTNFPTTSGAFQRTVVGTPGSEHAYVTKLNLAGTLGTLHLITPFRALDTRPSEPPGVVHVGTTDTGAAIAAAPLAGGSTRFFRLSFAGSPVPTAATGALLNVTAIRRTPGQGGYLTIFSGDQPAAPLASTLNPVTPISFNFWQVGLGPNATLGVFTTDAIDLALDVVGYYADDAAPDLGALHLITPYRALDTRPSDPPGITHTGTYADGTSVEAGPLPAGATKFYRLSTAGSPVPAGATGAVLNITVLRRSSGGGGYVTVFPGDQPTAPLASTLNPVTPISFNLWQVKVGPNATIGVYSTDAVDLAIDVAGFFAVGATAGTAPQLVTPSRALDTRPSDPPGITHVGTYADGTPVEAGPLPAGATKFYRLSVAGSPVPAGATGALLNVTVIRRTPGSGGYVTVFPGSDTSPPLASTLNPVTPISFNFWQVKVGPNATVGVFSTEPVDLAIDVVGIVDGG